MFAWFEFVSCVNGRLTNSPLEFTTRNSIFPNCDTFRQRGAARTEEEEELFDGRNFSMWSCQNHYRISNYTAVWEWFKFFSRVFFRSLLCTAAVLLQVEKLMELIYFPKRRQIDGTTRRKKRKILNETKSWKYFLFGIFFLVTNEWNEQSFLFSFSG